MILHFGLPLHPAAGGTQFSPAAILLTTQESENGIAMHGHVVLKNYVSEWPLTKIAKNSITDGADYLLDFYNDTPVNAVVGEAEIEQRIFYNEDFSYKPCPL